ncbi:hypothetical protein O3P69_007747 [Scylla paramamosain]|uniref:Uncharacterized protein n=1 Tax=Scylla paramamosain TaxID=85552 RepID=A0AAW0V263_SCYPA
MPREPEYEEDEQEDEHEEEQEAQEHESYTKPHHISCGRNTTRKTHKNQQIKNTQLSAPYVASIRKGRYSLSLSPFPAMAAQPPTPYDFAYGVSVPNTGDAKEHKETVSPSGRTEGEYRWLQPNGLYRVVRYFVEGDSGFQAEVSEEPGPDVANYYTNSLTQESSQGGAPAASQSQPASQASRPQEFINAISAPRPPPTPSNASHQTFKANQLSHMCQ